MPIITNWLRISFIIETVSSYVTRKLKIVDEKIISRIKSQITVNILRAIISETAVRIVVNAFVMTGFELGFENALSTGYWLGTQLTLSNIEHFGVVFNETIKKFATGKLKFNSKIKSASGALAFILRSMNIWSTKSVEAPISLHIEEGNTETLDPINKETFNSELKRNTNYVKELGQIKTDARNMLDLMKKRKQQLEELTKNYSNTIPTELSDTLSILDKDIAEMETITNTFETYFTELTETVSTIIQNVEDNVQDNTVNENLPENANTIQTVNKRYRGNRRKVSQHNNQAKKIYGSFTRNAEMYDARTRAVITLDKNKREKIKEYNALYFVKKQYAQSLTLEDRKKYNIDSLERLVTNAKIYNKDIMQIENDLNSIVEHNRFLRAQFKETSAILNDLKGRIPDKEYQQLEQQRDRFRREINANSREVAFAREKLDGFKSSTIQEIMEPTFVMTLQNLKSLLQVSINRAKYKNEKEFTQWSAQAFKGKVGQSIIKEIQKYAPNINPNAFKNFDEAIEFLDSVKSIALEIKQQETEYDSLRDQLTQARKQMINDRVKLKSMKGQITLREYNRRMEQFDKVDEAFHNTLTQLNQMNNRIRQLKSKLNTISLPRKLKLERILPSVEKFKQDVAILKTEFKTLNDEMAIFRTQVFEIFSRLYIPTATEEEKEATKKPTYIESFTDDLIAKYQKALNTLIENLSLKQAEKLGLSELFKQELAFKQGEITKQITLNDLEPVINIINEWEETVPETERENANTCLFNPEQLACRRTALIVPTIEIGITVGSFGSASWMTTALKYGMRYGPSALEGMNYITTLLSGIETDKSDILTINRYIEMIKDLEPSWNVGKASLLTYVNTITHGLTNSGDIMNDFHSIMGSIKDHRQPLDTVVVAYQITKTLFKLGTAVTPFEYLFWGDGYLRDFYRYTQRLRAQVDVIG